MKVVLDEKWKVMKNGLGMKSGLGMKVVLDEKWKVMKSGLG